MSSESIQVSKDSVKSLIPFNSLSDNHIDDTLKHARTIRVASGKMVFKRGDVTTERYYLLEGSVDLCDADFNITPLSADDPESAHALDPHNPHKVSAVTTSDTVLLAVDQKHLDLVLTWDQAGNYLVTDLSSKEEMAERDWMSCLLESSLISQVPPANIQKLFVTFAPMKAEKGELIIEQGEIGDLFYVIEQGIAEVTRRTKTGEEVLARLGPGDFFGEEALISDSTRNASVRMTLDGNLMCLEKEQFTKLLHEPVLQFITPDELQQHQANENIVLLDVRLQTEFDHEHSNHAINIPLGDLRKELDKLDCELSPNWNWVKGHAGNRYNEECDRLAVEAVNSL